MEKIVKIYDRNNYLKLIKGMKVVQIDKIDNTQTKEDIRKLEDLSISRTFYCSFCKINFDNFIQQRQHCKSDWHRYNLKLNLKAQEPITEDKFDQLAGLADDISSISGSEISTISGSNSENEDDFEKDINVRAASHGKIFFKNEEGKYFSMYRSVLLEKKETPANDEALFLLVRQNSKNIYWTILLLGGGHFAGAVFNGSDIVEHKTFHRYTVRAKQGTSQGSRDGKSGGSHPKSPGSILRRYNEHALTLQVTNLLQNWSTHIEKSTTIFYRAVGAFNRSVLFGGKNSNFKKKDGRLRNVPFATDRPTFAEVKRVHDILTNIEVFESFDLVLSQFITQKVTEENYELLGRQDRHNSPKYKNTVKYQRVQTLTEEDSSDTDKDLHLETKGLKVSFTGLQQNEDTIPIVVEEQKGIRKGKLRKKDGTKERQDNSKKELCNICRKRSEDSSDFKQYENAIPIVAEEKKAAREEMSKKKEGTNKSQDNLQQELCERSEENSSDDNEDIHLENKGLKVSFIGLKPNGNTIPLVAEERKTVRKEKLENKDGTKARQNNMKKELYCNICRKRSEDDSSDTDEDINSENKGLVEVPFTDFEQYKGTVPLVTERERVFRKEKLREKDETKKRQDNYLRKELYNVCRKGSMEELQSILQEIKDYEEENEHGDLIRFLETVNMCVDEHGNTPLHIAALNNQNDLVLFLLENGATPCTKNDKQITPYTINANKDIRTVFRKFASDFPDRYNYPESSIPVFRAIMTEKELARKKKAQRKARRGRIKETKKENEMKRKEEDKRDRFLNKTLAAERRLLTQTPTVLVC